MASSGYVKISRKGINHDAQFYKGLKKTFEKYSEEIFQETFNMATTEAITLVEKAEYNGVNDVEVIPKMFKYGGRITLKGDALPYIEYGTGVFGEGYSKGEFRAFGQYKEKIESGYKALKNEEAEANIRVHRKLQYDTSKEIAKTKEHIKRYKTALKGWFYTAKPGDKLSKHGHIPDNKNPNKTSRFTRGNKANHIIDRLHDKINERFVEEAAQKVAKRHKK